MKAAADHGLCCLLYYSLIDIATKSLKYRNIRKRNMSVEILWFFFEKKHKRRRKYIPTIPCHLRSETKSIIKSTGNPNKNTHPKDCPHLQKIGDSFRGNTNLTAEMETGEGGYSLPSKEHIKDSLSILILMLYKRGVEFRLLSKFERAILEF